ncbi:MAG: [Fe-S]-binding protein [Planctomycetia bacterium]|nr:[Fe-S]-binding protein [Planctomycetia bacterium]
MSGYPRVLLVRQALRGPTIADVPAAVHDRLAALHLEKKILPGQSVAITAGSRGIRQIDVILRATVEHLRGLEAEPFLVPAMGSHGGATAEGQLSVLAKLGISEATMGCPIRSGMETTLVCQAAEGFPVYCDRIAAAADHVLVCGRVKAHTSFTGDIQSGLMKMLLTGLGKHAGALVYHRAVIDFGFPQIVRSVAATMLARCRVVAGLAIVENGGNETALIEAILPQDFEACDRRLLKQAIEWMPRLPVQELDVLLIDELGKDISGTGMDTNVIGRKYHDHEAADDEWPKVRRIVVRGLSDATGGNANGIGMAEFCTQRAVAQADLALTRINSLTANHAPAGMLPIDFPTDRAALDAALKTIGLREPHEARLAWIRNTRDLEVLALSESYAGEVQRDKNLTLLGPAQDLPFDATGNLPRFVGDGINPA